LTFANQARIRRELIVPHNPQQNGVVERKNRSIEENVKELLNNQGLSMYIWGEAAMKRNICSEQKSSPHIEGYNSRRILLRKET
jgi:hypothetical protein